MLPSPLLSELLDADGTTKVFFSQSSTSISSSRRERRAALRGQDSSSRAAKSASAWLKPQSRDRRSARSRKRQRRPARRSPRRRSSCFQAMPTRPRRSASLARNSSTKILTQSFFAAVSPFSIMDRMLLLSCCIKLSGTATFCSCLNCSKLVKSPSKVPFTDSGALTADPVT